MFSGFWRCCRVQFRSFAVLGGSGAVARKGGDRTHHLALRPRWVVRWLGCGTTPLLSRVRWRWLLWLTRSGGASCGEEVLDELRQLKKGGRGDERTVSPFKGSWIVDPRAEAAVWAEMGRAVHRRDRLAVPEGLASLAPLLDEYLVEGRPMRVVLDKNAGMHPDFTDAFYKSLHSGWYAVRELEVVAHLLVQSVLNGSPLDGDVDTQVSESRWEGGDTCCGFAGCGRAGEAQG